MSDNQDHSTFESNQVEQNKKGVVNGFFDILKLRMGEYREFKMEQRNQKAVENFQNFSAQNNMNPSSHPHNTPFDENVTIDETKYRL